MKTKLIYFASSPFVLFLKSSFKYFYLLLFLFFNNSIDLHAQLFHNPPGIEWKRADWFPDHPVNGPQIQDDSGEEWWYTHSLSKINGATEGYICAGYSTMRNLLLDETPNGGCGKAGNLNADCCELESTGNVKGADFSIIGFVTPNGKKLKWIKKYIQGNLMNIKQTSDGGYIAIGTTLSTRNTDNSAFLPYNPTTGNTTDYLQDGVANVVNGGSPNYYIPHTTVLKINHDGDIEWQNLYGMFDYYDTGNPQPEYEFFKWMGYC